MAAIDQGKADFVALGRPLLADPDWVGKTRTGLPVRRCIACNTCVDGMRGGAPLACLVNPMAGRERIYEKAEPPSGEKIAVIGAGPAGLSYASLVAHGNEVTVFERAAEDGGALRLAGKAPLFQNVEADETTLMTYIGELEHDCRTKGVAFRFGVDLRSQPDLLGSFDRIVVASGAAYRFRTGPIVERLLAAGAGPLLQRVFAAPRLREWFYYRARRPRGEAMRRRARPEQAVIVIGDARAAGKASAAIESAFEAALLDRPKAAAAERAG